MKKIMILLIALILYSFLNAQTNVFGPTVGGAWTQANSPYYVFADIEIPVDNSLIIEPGVEIIFQGHYGFYVYGYLYSIGSASDPIAFTISDTTGFSNPESISGSWKGFIFENEYATISTESVISYCDISYAKKIGGYFECKGGAIYIDYGGNVDVTHNRLHHNLAFHGGAIFMHVPTLITHNFISDNYAIHSGGGIYTAFNDVIMVNNVFSNNRASAAGGGVRLGGCENITFCNNTLVDNLSENGNSIFYSYHYSMNVYNNIIWGDLEDGPQIYFNDVGGIINFYNCNIAGGMDNIAGVTGYNFIGEYVNNMNADPGFMNTGDDIYALTPESYCVNSGVSDNWNPNFWAPETDIIGNDRIYEGEIDIGAYELQQESLVCSAPIITPDGGAFSNPQMVELETITPDALIYYTTDGSEPNQNSILYEESFQISTTCSVKAKVYKENYIESLMATANFCIGSSISGQINGIISLENSPYYVTGDLYVIESEELEIEPGVEFYFADHYSFNVEGNIIAQGTESDPILFTTNNYSAGWNGFSLVNTNINQVVIFDHCIFSYAKTLDNVGMGGAIYAENFPEISITNSTFEHNTATIGGAIYLDNCVAVIGNCEIINNNSTNGAGGIMIHNTSTVKLANNNFESNISEGFGGAIISYESFGYMINNRIIDNHAHFGGGLYFKGDYSSGSPTMIGNLICQNSSNHMGAAVYIEHFSDVKVINCTITDNYAQSTNNVSAVFIYYGCYPEFTNTILWNPGISELDVDTGVASDPVFNYCDFQDWSGIYSGANNIDLDPLFVNLGNNQYQITLSSPCLEAGTPDTTGLFLPQYDLLNNPRIWDGDGNGEALIDIGAYEFNIPVPVGYITGFVSDMNGNPLENAEISIENSSVFTDENGEYEIEVETGDHIVSCFLEGYVEPEDVETSVMDNEIIVIDFILEPEVNAEDILTQNIHLSNFPNPFNPSTTISFNVTQSSAFATIEIYNLKGQKVKTFSNLQITQSQNHQIVWNGTDDNNKPVSSGIYFYKLKAGKLEKTKKMLLLK